MRSKILIRKRKSLRKKRKSKKAKSFNSGKTDTDIHKEVYDYSLIQLNTLIDNLKKKTMPEMSIDGIIFKLLFNFYIPLTDEPEIKNKEFICLKNVTYDRPLIFYRSRSELGTFRLMNGYPSGKPGHYVTGTFVHIELQKFILNNLDKLDDIKFTSRYYMKTLSYFANDEYLDDFLDDIKYNPYLEKSIDYSFSFKREHEICHKSNQNSDYKNLEKFIIEIKARCGNYNAMNNNKKFKDISKVFITKYNLHVDNNSNYDGIDIDNIAYFNKYLKFCEIVNAYFEKYFRITKINKSYGYNFYIYYIRCYINVYEVYLTGKDGLNTYIITVIINLKIMINKNIIKKHSDYHYL